MYSYFVFVSMYNNSGIFLLHGMDTNHDYSPQLCWTGSHHPFLMVLPLLGHSRNVLPVEATVNLFRPLSRTINSPLIAFPAPATPCNITHAASIPSFLLRYIKNLYNNRYHDQGFYGRSVHDLNEKWINHKFKDGSRVSHDCPQLRHLSQSVEEWR